LLFVVVEPEKSATCVDPQSPRSTKIDVRALEAAVDAA